MLYVIARKDNEGMADERARLLSKHVEYQKAFMSFIVFGGGLVKEGFNESNFVYNEKGIRDVIGNLLVVDVPDRAAAEAIHFEDPYTKGGIFNEVIIEPFLKRVPIEN